MFPAGGKQPPRWAPRATFAWQLFYSRDVSALYGTGLYLRYMQTLSSKSSSISFVAFEDLTLLGPRYGD